jgi:hypothetical protein
MASKTSNGNSTSQGGLQQSPKKKPGTFWSLQRLKFRRDHRSRLPPIISRFTGYRPPDATPPYDPLPFPPFTWLAKLPLHYEIWLLGWIGAFGGIILIEAIMSTSTAFRDVYQSPIIITSFGASAVLLFGVIESPVAQPRNFVLGHFISALVGTCITRLFDRDPQYQGYLDNDQFHPSTFINGGLSMATSLLAMLITGTAHPPYVAYPFPSQVFFRLLLYPPKADFLAALERRG